MDFKKFNFNLLSLFDALYRYRNGTVAAKSLGMAQPNLSRALQDLRETFGDPLFVRSSHGMTPTVRAESLAPLVQDALRQLEEIYADKPLDLLNATERVTVASTDYMELLLGAGLVKAAQQNAPNITISFRPLTGQLPKEAMERGEIDLALASYFDDLPGGFYKKVLFTTPFVLLVRNEHPLALKKMKPDIQDLIDFPFSLISTRGDLIAELDKKLHKLKLKRRIILAVPNSLSAVWAILDSDLCLIAAKNFADDVKKTLPIATLPLPIEIRQLRMTLVWHERSHHDPLRRWVRDQISAISQNRSIAESHKM